MRAPTAAGTHSVPAARRGVAPGRARAAVAPVDVVQAPADLGLRVRPPVGSGAGHLPARVGLRDAVRPRAGVAGEVVPVALARPQPVQAPPLPLGPATLDDQRYGQGAVPVGRGERAQIHEGGVVVVYGGAAGSRQGDDAADGSAHGDPDQLSTHNGYLRWPGPPGGGGDCGGPRPPARPAATP